MLSHHLLHLMNGRVILAGLTGNRSFRSGSYDQQALSGLGTSMSKKYSLASVQLPGSHT